MKGTVIAFMIHCCGTPWPPSSQTQSTNQRNWRKSTVTVLNCRTQFICITLQGINISHLGKRKIIFKMPFLGDMLVPWRVSIFKLQPFSLFSNLNIRLVPTRTKKSFQVPSAPQWFQWSHCITSNQGCWETGWFRIGESIQWKNHGGFEF